MKKKIDTDDTSKLIATLVTSGVQGYLTQKKLMNKIINEAQPDSKMKINDPVMMEISPI